MLWLERVPIDDVDVVDAFKAFFFSEKGSEAERSLESIYRVYRVYRVYRETYLEVCFSATLFYTLYGERDAPPRRRMHSPAGRGVPWARRPGVGGCSVSSPFGHRALTFCALPGILLASASPLPVESALHLGKLKTAGTVGETTLTAPSPQTLCKQEVGLGALYLV